MKYTYIYALFLAFVFHGSCGRSQTHQREDKIDKGNQPKAQPKANSAGEAAVALAATSKVPISMVRNVKLAKNGDILIASYLGVFRYDGTSFTNLTSKISPPLSSSFWDVLEDRKGNLWLGTRDSGAYYYNGKTFQHFTKTNGLASNTAHHLYEDKTGSIWLGASRYDGKSFRHLSTNDGFPSNNIRLLLEDQTGKRWFGAQGEELFVQHGKSFTVLKNKDGKAFNNVWSVIEDKKGNIWFGDTGGLWRYDGTTFTNVSKRGAYGIIQDKKGNLWTTGAVNAERSALSRYAANTLYDKNPKVTEISSGGPMAFLGLVEANDGSIWWGSGGGGAGVYRYDGKTITDFRSKKEQP